MPVHIKKHLTARTIMLAAIIIGAIVCVMPFIMRPPTPPYTSSAMPAGVDPIGELAQQYR